MEPVIRLVCTDCLRSVDAGGAHGRAAAHPAACDRCGGPVEAHRDDPSDEYETPLSLVLTPEETPHWFDRESAEAGRIDLQPPASLGRFQLREVLGGGGFGLVYRAYDPRLDRDVALKVLRDAQPTARVMERFFREARAAAQLDHPNIVPLHDAGRDEGRCWIAYQYVDGRPLSWLAAERLAWDPARAARIGRDLADALDHAHRRGVVHRDVKPSNVIVDLRDRPRLTDFGLARRLDFDATMTVEGTILGTPAYMSPEQAAGRSHGADARSDVYSLGVLLYELLSGRRPADLPSDIPAWRAELRTPPPPLSRSGRRIPAALDRICRRALAPEAADRFADARSLADALDAWLDRRRRGAWILAPALALGIACGAAGPLILQGTGPPADGPRVGAEGPANRPPAGSRGSPPAGPVRFVLPAGAVTGGRLLAPPGGRIFHREGCRALDRVAVADCTAFPGATEARGAGLVPCTVCAPAATVPRPSGHGPGGASPSR